MKNTFKNQIRAALFAAIIAVLTLISIPTPTGIPLTFQTFAIALSGFFLGSKYGTEAVLIYLAVGTMGLPVFSGMTGGIGKILGVTGGFLVGFIPMSALCGIKKSHIKNLVSAFSGLMICHLFGIFGFAFVSKSDLLSAFSASSLPYLFKDILSVAAAYAVSVLTEKRIKI